MISAHTLSNGNNCLTFFLFNVVTLWPTEMPFAGNTIYSHSCDAGPGWGHFRPHSCPSSSQKHPPRSGQWDASLPAVGSSSPSPPPPLSFALCKVVLLLNVHWRATTGFPLPQSQQGFAQLLVEAEALGRCGEWRISCLLFYSAMHLQTPSSCTVMQHVLKSTACICLFAALLLVLRKSCHSLVIITIAKTHFIKLSSTFSVIRGRIWEQEQYSWAAIPALASLAGCNSLWAVRHIVFHRKCAFTSWSPLKFLLAGAGMFPYMVLADK